MNEMNLETYDTVVVPAAALRREQCRTKYGTLKDLQDEELAGSVRFFL